MRLIDADALMDKVNNTFAPFVTLLSDAPTIDAVEVVRCRDCKYYHKWSCEKDSEVVSDDFYCACGDRADKIVEY